MTPLNMSETERLAFDRAMDQWRRSLKRPDLAEEDRVKGALLAYQRQIIACEMLERAKP
jgi:hypothetical protein